MENIICKNCGVYDSEFFLDLKGQLESKISFLSSKDLKNNIYNLGLCVNLLNYMNLIDLLEIVNKVLDCSSCFDFDEVETIVDIVKRELSK